MRHVYMSDERERQAFAEKAARHFKSDRGCFTYTADNIEPGAWFAVRWGMGEDCVLVFRVGDETPVIYGQLIRDVDGGAA